MTLTARYSVIHNALREAAHERELPPHVARVALAVYERGGEASTRDLYDDLAEHGSQLRRSLGVLYSSELATGTGSDGGARRRGVHALVTLTDAGVQMCEEVLAEVYDPKGRA